MNKSRQVLSLCESRRTFHPPFSVKRENNTFSVIDSRDQEVKSNLTDLEARAYVSKRNKQDKLISTAKSADSAEDLGAGLVDVLMEKD